MESGTSNCFRFADFNIEVEFAQGNHNIFRYLPSFRHFAIDKEQVKEPLLFKMTIDSTLTVIDKSRLEEIGDFDTGNGKVDVKRITDGGYQFKFKDLDGRACCLLQTDKAFQQLQVWTERQLQHAELRAQQRHDGHVLVRCLKVPDPARPCFPRQARRLWICLYRQERNGKVHSGELLAEVSAQLRLDERRQSHHQNH
jgi:hypothetical protein